MRNTILLFFMLSMVFSGFSQNTVSSQMNDLAQAIPSYYLGFSKVVFDNVGSSVAFGFQSQHWKTNWKVKYGLSVATPVFGSVDPKTNSVQRDNLYQSESIYYMGALGNALGSEDASFIRQYLVTENGDRIVNPINGEFVKIDFEMPSGLQSSLGAIPSVMPSLEIRLWKGLIVSGGLVPMSYFLRDFKQNNFETKVNFYAIGGSLNMRNFFKIPVLSWLRFDASYNVISVKMDNLQDLIDLSSIELFDIGFNSMAISSNINTSQYRASIAIPTIKDFVLVGQIGYINHSYDFNFDYNIDVVVDDKKLKEDYNIDFKGENITLDDRYTYQQVDEKLLYYSGGLMVDGKVATFFIGYADINYPTFVFKTSLKLL